MSDEEEYVEVYRASSSTQAHLFASALEDAGIKAFVEGDALQAGLGVDALGWTAAPKILVPNSDLGRALRNSRPHGKRPRGRLRCPSEIDRFDQRRFVEWDSCMVVGEVASASPIPISWHVTPGNPRDILVAIYRGGFGSAQYIPRSAEYLGN